MTPSSEDVSPEKKAKTFSCQTFRQELKGSEALKSLKKFISAAKNSDDVIFEYLDNGGSLFEILSLIDVTAKGDLTTALPVFEVVHLILLRFQSSDSQYHQHCIEAARTILSSYLLTIRGMLTMTVTKQRKVALKLLTAIVTLHSSFANEIINVMTLTPTLIADIIHPTPDKESVRKYFILFILSFLVEGNPSVIKNFLDKKGFLSSIIPGLKFDEASTINLTLSVLEDKILKNSKIPKTLKLKLFNTQNIKSLFKLFDWKGPQGVKPFLPSKKQELKQVEVNQKDKDLVAESAHSFLLLLCSSKKFGVAFFEKSLGASESLNNELLLTVFESMPDALNDKKIADILLKTLTCCPDLIKPVLSALEPSFQPRNSTNWFEAFEFAENLIKSMDPVSALKSNAEHLTSNQIFKVAKNVCTPIVFLRNARSGTQKPHSVEIRLSSLKLLAAMWTETRKLLKGFREHEASCKKSINQYISNFLPDAEDLLELWHNLCDTEALVDSCFPLDKRPSFLMVLLNSLHMIVECQRDVVNSPLKLASDMLGSVEVIKETMSDGEYNEIQVKIVEFLEIDLESLTPDMELFEKSLLILFRSSNDSSLSCASKILLSTGIFKSNESEMDVWLLCLISVTDEHRDAVAVSLIESLRRFFVNNADYKFSHDCFQMDGILEEADMKTESTPEDQTKALTPLLSECIEVLKNQSSSSVQDDSEQAEAFRLYLTEVIIHLQHFLTNNIYLYDRLKSYKKILGKYLINYLKSWTDSSLESIDLDLMACPQERELISWLLDIQNDHQIEDVVTSDNLLKSSALYRIVLAYLVYKITNDDLGINDVRKYSNALLFFIKLGDPSLEYQSKINVISYDFKNRSVYQRHCLRDLFLNETLLNSFDVFNKKKNGAFYSTAVMKALMKSSIRVDKSLIESWKKRFLGQLKSKLKKNKSIDGVENLEAVLDFFEFDRSDIVDVIDLLISFSDLNVFMQKKKISKWIVILERFIKLLCEKEELSDGVIQKLCLIMKHLSQNGCSDLEVVDNCFNYLLRKHPQHLVLIGNDFLEVLLQRTNITSSTSTLGKLLLNDPNKVKYFLKIAQDNLEVSQLVFPMLSVLLISEDSFVEVFKSESTCLVWKTSEIDKESSPELFHVLEAVYEKFEENIVRAVAGKKEDLILENLNVALVLIKLFMSNKTIKKLKKEIDQSDFHAELYYEAIRKLSSEEATETYLRGLLAMFGRIIRNGKDIDESVWQKFCSIVTDIIESKKESTWKNVVDSSEWKEFPVLALGLCFSFSKYPHLMKILRILIAALYSPQNESKDLSLFFQRVISHSQFLNVILSSSPLKSELVELFHSLVERNPSEMSAKHIPVLLASYTASMSSCDETLLKILRLYEKSVSGVNDYEPFVWGETAVSHYSIGTNPGLSLWQRFNMGNVLDLLDSQRMEMSLKEFPIKRLLERNSSLKTENDSAVYDPAFLLPLFVSLLSPGAVVFCLPFIYRGALAYTIRSLSSECSDVRISASVVLTRFYNHLEMTQKMKQKLVWMHFIDCFRYGIEDLKAQPLPNITTLFFARMTLELSQKPAEMYLPLQNYLLSKPYFVFDTIPEFMPLFHSSEVSHRKHREWLLEVLRDGVKNSLDVKVIYYSMSLKVIFSFFQSQLCDNEKKKLILQVLVNMLKIQNSILLISEYGLLNWINSISPDSSQVILNDLIKLLHASATAVIKDLTVRKSMHSNLSQVIQILNIEMKLLPALNASNSVETFEIFLKTIFDCLVLFVNKERIDWFLLNKNKLDEMIEVADSFLGKSYDCGRFRKVPFYFREFDERSAVEENLNKIVFLFNMLSNKGNN